MTALKAGQIICFRMVKFSALELISSHVRAVLISPLEDFTCIWNKSLQNKRLVFQKLGFLHRRWCSTSSRFTVLNWIVVRSALYSTSLNSRAKRSLVMRQKHTAKRYRATSSILQYIVGASRCLWVTVRSTWFDWMYFFLWGDRPLM